MATVVVSRIGAAVLGRDYATLSAWEAASPADLQATDQIWQGQAFDDALYSEAFAITANNPDATRYMELKAAPGQEYDPIAATGVSNVTATTAPCVIVGNFSRMAGLRMEVTGNGAVDCISGAGTNLLVERCVGIMAANTTTGRSVFDLAGAGTVNRHCIAIGGGGTGARRGFANAPVAQHCIAYNMDDGLNASNGFLSVACTNCLAIDCNANAGADYSGGSVTTSGASDATGSPAALDTLVAATIWVAPAANDFRPAAAWTAAQAGTTIAGITSDFAGNGIVGAHDVGAYEFPTSGLTTTVGRTEGRSIPRNFSFAGRHRVKSRPSIR